MFLLVDEDQKEEVHAMSPDIWAINHCLAIYASLIALNPSTELNSL